MMDWIWQRCLFLADEVDPPLAKPPEMVLIVSRRGGSVGVTSVRAGWGSWFADWLGRIMVSVIAAIFSHVHVGRSGLLTWWWDEVSL